MSKIRVGHSSNPENHVKINDSSVSRVHLEVSKIDNDTLRIVDLGSSNGTKIDDLEIVESTLKRHQSIKIGYQNYSGDEFFNKTYKYFLDKRVHWIEEFAALETEFKKYEKQKAKINQTLQNKMNIVRGALGIVIASVFFMFGEDIGIPAEYKYITSVAGGVLAGIIVPYLISKENATDHFVQLKRKYSRTLVCPRCHKDLSNGTFKFWKEEKKCSSCDAIWVK